MTHKHTKGSCAAPGCDCKKFKNEETRREDSNDADRPLEHPMVTKARAELALTEEDDVTVEKLLDIVRIWSTMGHSGSSHAWFREVLVNLLNQRALTPLTDDPKEWQRHEPDRWDGVNAVWQNRRDSRALSTNGGKTYFLVDDEDRNILYDSLQVVAPPRPEHNIYPPYDR